MDYLEFKYNRYKFEFHCIQILHPHAAATTIDEIATTARQTWWWLWVLSKKEAKSGRSSGAVTEMRRQSIHSDTMPQIKDNSRWLSQGWGILAIVTQFGQIVSTSADRLILNQNKTLLWIAAKNKVLTADKIATAEDGLGKVFCNPVNRGRIAEST